MSIEFPILDPNALNCGDCPANDLKNDQTYSPSEKGDWETWVRYCESLREGQAKEIINTHGKIKLYILAESIPKNRFVYDRDSDYRGKKEGWLRKKFCEGLLGGCPENVKSCKKCQNLDRLMDFLKKQGILIVDCALCPLHNLSSNKERRAAATICLNRHTSRYLDITPNAPIVTFFPGKTGFYKKDTITIKPEIESRILDETKLKFKYLKCFEECDSPDV